MTNIQDTAYPRMIDLRLPRYRIGNRYLAVRYTETAEVDTQLKTEVEYLIIRIGSVLRLLGLYWTKDRKTQNKE